MHDKIYMHNNKLKGGNLMQIENVNDHYYQEVEGKIIQIIINPNQPKYGLVLSRYMESYSEEECAYELIDVLIDNEIKSYDIGGREYDMYFDDKGNLFLDLF
jgi:hypothetical protein